MCHLLLILPLVALPVFWLLPLSVALPGYGAVLGLSALVYWYAIRAMHQPRLNGAEGMVGQTGEIVVGRFGEMHVHIRNELWEAISDFPLPQGECVKVVAAADSTRLRVHALAALARDQSPAPGNEEAASGAIL